MLKIGEVVVKLGVSADTLRYYEKVELIPKVQRNGAGIRFYNDKNLSRIKFIKRAQRMGFSLNEISQLLVFREEPQRAKPDIRQLVKVKLADIESHQEDLQTLHNELQLLVNLCPGSEDGCPIIDGLEDD
ncbi:MAG: heavy metal-responsive transcriptional regulator [Gammaproteobacteria bacterium]|nr:MAG: heavy metal-responsive transcriptional regulator [Gammaproteobacteria bacterium]